jgi:hypothetical protein
MQPTRQAGANHYSKRTPEKVRRGPDAPGAKLSETQIADMCAERAAGVAQTILAEKYQVSRYTVWRHTKDVTRDTV